MTRRVAVTLALVAAGLVPATARGDGLPVPVDDAGPTGVVTPDGSTRFVTLPVSHGTIVEKISTSSGVILDWKRINGRFTIPVVALDGTPGGMSHDGRTVALIRPRSGFPRASTTLTFLHPRAFFARPKVITLHGDFSFDALSPDGRVAYLVQYVNPNDPTKYNVRALQTATGHLAPRPIVDPHEHGDEMSGYPATRVASADGRWQYTLYDRSGGKPFVHALDTQAGKAKCIDLPIAGQDVYSMRLSVPGGGGTLAVTAGRRNLATVDLATFHVSTPTARSKSAGHVQTGGSSSAPAAWIAGLGLVLALAGAALTRRRRRGAATPA